MNSELSDVDRRLLTILQSGIPISEKPFKDAANKLGISEQDVVDLVEGMKESGAIRKLGAVISSKALGYKSLLAAMDVKDEDVDKIAAIINKYSSVTHNYLRESSPNLWFTMTEPDQERLDRHIAEIERTTGLPIIRMPADKTYKIGVKIDI
jgi:DNA-binding Lrp family transcriptional regulator